MASVRGTIGFGALSIIAHWSMASVGTIAVSIVFHTNTILSVSVGVPNLAYGVICSTRWSFKRVNS